MSARGAGPYPVPDYLPRYDLNVKLDTNKHTAEIHQRTTWTNKTQRPTETVVFNFYPRFEIKPSESLLFAKTLEMLRMNPEYGIDPLGAFGTVQDIRLVVGDLPAAQKRLTYTYAKDNPCALYVQLPRAVGPGESVMIDMDCTIRLPHKQGRVGHWNGISYLTNALPTVAYYDDTGWHDKPFIPWHQPFWNEAGIYQATIQVPADQCVVTPAEVKSEAEQEGWKTTTYAPFVGRDFALLASAHYQKTTRQIQVFDGRTITVDCYAERRHEASANSMVEIASKAIETYSRWFGPYPYERFTIAESYFGWNGNECSGLILIDERVFDMPQAGYGYIEYLVSHETCHQWWYNLIGTNGYSETFMDEGPATYFSHRMLDIRRGKNNQLMNWSRTMSWVTPTIRRENYRFGPITMAIRRHEVPPAAGPLPDFGNLYKLFSGAYDRGSKVFGMIEDRLGEDAYIDFTREIVKKYAFRYLSAKDLKRELEAYSGKNWDDLFDRWVYGKG